MLYLIGKMVERGLDHWSDILVLVIYFMAVLAVGLWVSQLKFTELVNSINDSYVII